VNEPVAFAPLASPRGAALRFMVSDSAVTEHVVWNAGVVYRTSVVIRDELDLGWASIGTGCRACDSPQ
jgi:hypothetical protein